LSELSTSIQLPLSIAAGTLLVRLMCRAMVNDDRSDASRMTHSEHMADLPPDVREAIRAYAEEVAAHGPHPTDEQMRILQPILEEARERLRKDQ
jgi:hypothetical protein